MANVELNIHVQIKELQKGLKQVEAGQKKMAAQSGKTQKAMQKNIQGTTKSVQGLGAAFITVFSIAAVTKLTKSIITIRSEFEKYRAVLTNTLGSAAAANREFDKIQKFAAETPFAVRTLTDAFVRLVNQGFTPTMKQMTLLGDLAAATGKDFIQLTEAILDAQTGEFERLKDFGIKAKKEGDKVTFTFKEQATQVAFTSRAIQDYILSLGALEGVSGAMAAVSETLGGQINNLSDKWDKLLDVLGGRTEGVFFKAMDLLGGLLDGITKFNELADPETAGRRRANVLVDAFGEIDEAELAVINRWIRTYSGSIIQLQQDIATLQAQGGTGMLDGVLVADKSKVGTLIEQREELISLVQTLKGYTIAEEENTVAAEDNTKADAKRRKAWLQSLELTQKLEEEEAKYTDSMVDFNFFQEESAIQTEDITDRLKQDATDKADHIIAENERIRISEMILNQARLGQRAENLEVAAAGLDFIGAITKENAQLQQGIAISQAIINGALAITKVQAQTGVLSPAFIIATALTTLAQIATIKSQKFERGGYDVLGGNRHAQGGVNIGIGEAEAGEGLAVFNRTATQKYGKFLPAFVKAINENNGELGYSDGAYMISFDDSKSVKELKGIKDILNKPEIRYEGRYRIETRKGQVTRVKI